MITFSPKRLAQLQKSPLRPPSKALQKLLPYRADRFTQSNPYTSNNADIFVTTHAAGWFITVDGHEDHDCFTDDFEQVKARIAHFVLTYAPQPFDLNGD